MAKEVSIGVKVKLQADAKEMQRIIDDLETRLSNVKTDSSLGKSLSKQLQKMKDSLGDFNLLSGQQIINSSDLTTATTLARNFYKQVGRFSEDYEKGSFSAFSFDKKQLKELETAQKALEDFDKSRKDSLNKKTNGEVFGKYTEEAKGIQKAFKEIKKDVNKDSSFLDTKKDIEHSKKKAQEEASTTERKLVKETQLKQEADVAKQSAENNLKIKQQELAKVQKLEQNYQKRKEVADEISKKESFKDAKEFRDYFNSSVFQKGGINFKSGGKEKVSQMLALMGFNPDEIPEGVKELKEKIAKEISNASDDEVKNLADKMYGNAKDFSSKGYKDAQKKTKTATSNAQNEVDNAQKKLNQASEAFEKRESSVKELESSLSTQQLLAQQLDSLEKEIDSLWKKLNSDEEALNKEKREELKADIEAKKEKVMSTVKGYTGAVKEDASKLYQGVHSTKEEEKARQQAEQEAANFKANLQSSIKHWMGAQQVITLVRQGIRQAYQDIQGLDKAMTNIAVVTDFNVSDLWGRINDYMQVAQQYGVTTQGVYEVSQLYFQQGLGEADTMAATTETLKMARIAGMDYAEAADGMTVAIRGFNMEMQDAARVTDVYSKVAAITASDTQELVTAMSKTASSAAAVGSSFENTTAMLAVMIEATRESPQNLGSALKSIISRYGEMTKGVDVDEEGEEIDYNRVDTALKTVGISLKDAQGQFRDFDTVIEELSAKWDTLDSVTQRYIATIFAGNRQQSRFLALVSNYERYMEVSEAAANSEDAGLLQYSKTLDSLETKINNIKTSFQQFYMSLINGDNIKGALDFINSLIKGLNKLNKLSSVFSLTGIITSVKLVGSSLVNSLTPYITQISNKFKQGYAEIANSSRTGGMTAGKAFRDAYENAIATGSTETQAMRAGGWAGIKAFGKKHASSIANMAALAGSGLSLLGISTASDNAVLGSSLSMAGSTLSGAAMGASFGPWGALIGGITGAVSQLPSLIKSLDKNVQAQEQLTKLRETTEEKNIERAQAKSDYENLSSLLKQYKDLEETRYDNDETYEKWLDVNNQLTEAYPALLSYIDEHGNAIADITNASTLLSNAMQNAANATADYYYAKVAEIEQELRISRETVYAPHYTRGYNKREAGYKEFSQAKQSALQYSTINAHSHLQQMTSEQIMNWVKGEGVDLQKALADIQGHGKGYSGIADYLWFIGAIEESAEGVFSWAEDFNKYIKATEQLQTLDVTKKTGALAGISNASKLSTFDDAIEGISGYTALIETYATSFKDMSWEDLVKISEEDYDKLIREFVLFYDGLSTSQQEILSDLYDNLQNLSLSDLQTQFKDFGLEDTKLYQTYYKEWINQNYQTRYKLAESIFGKDAFITKKDLYSSEEFLALASGEQVRSLKDEKFGTYAEWLEQGGYEDNAKNREIYYQRSIAFIKDINEGLGNFIENSTLSQLQLYANFLNKEASVQEGGGIAAKVSADRQKTITDLISRVFDKEDSFFSLLKPETLAEFFDLLFTEPGTNEWAKNLQQFETEYGDLGVDFSQLVFENFLAQTNIVLDKIDSFTEKIDDLATKQEKGFTLTESFDLLKELQKIDSSATWDNIFKYNEEGILVLKDFSSVLDSLYEDQFNIEDLRSKYQTGLEFIESLAQNKDVLASEALDLRPEADLEDYTIALSAGADLSPEVIDSMATYLSQNADATIESFTEWYYQTFGVPLENAQQYFDNYKENKLQEDTIRKRTEQLEGTLEERNKQAAYQMLSSKGLEGYSADEIAQLETYLGSDLGAIETGEGTGEYRIDLSKLKDLKPWVWNAINSIIEESIISTEENLASLGEKMGAGEATTSDATEAFGALQKFMGWTNEFLVETITQSLGNREQLNDLIAKQLLANQGRYDILEVFKNTPAFLMPVLTPEQQAAFDAIKLQASEYGDGMIAAYAQSTRQKLTKFFELSQDMILGDISPEELEELGDMGFDVSKFNTNLIAALMQHGQQVIDQMAKGNIDFDTGKELLEKDYENALAARAYAEEFNIPLAQVTGLNAKSLSYFSDTMETVRKSENTFDSAAAGKIAFSVSAMLGIPEMAGQILSLFNWDQDEKFWSIDKDNTERMLNAFNAGAGSEMHQWLTQATEGEQAYAHLLSNKGSQADFQQLATLANQIEDPERRKSALTTLQAMQSFYDVVAEAELDKKIKDFDKTKAFADDLESIYQSLASGEKITAEALQEIFETLDYTPEQDVTEIVSNGADAILSSIESAIQAGAQTDADAAEIAARIGKLRAILLDSIISSISSNSSNLKSGIEGTLSASDWTAAVKKYGLSAGRATQTAKGLRLDNAAQLEYATAIYKEALDNDLAWDAVDAIYEQVAGTEGIFKSYESIRAEMAGMIDDNGIVLDQYKEQYALLQSMAHSALMNPDDSRFSFMEQDSVKGMTQSFDKFVDNIDKVKNAFSSFQSDGTAGYQDFWNMMDYMNKFGTDGGTNQFISKITEAGYTYEDFINTVVTKSKEFGKVDIGTIAAEMGISVDAAMSAMSEGMTESLKEVARQQIKYLSGLEAMLEALLILEQISGASFEFAFDFKVNMNGQEHTISDFGDLYRLMENFNSLPDNEKKSVLLDIKKGFDKNNLGGMYDSLFGDGDYDFWDRAILSKLSTEEGFNAIKQKITDNQSSLAQLFAKANKSGSFGEGLAEYMSGIFSLEGMTWDSLFEFDDKGIITGLSQAAKDKGFTPDQIFDSVFDQLLGVNVTDFDESFRQKITDAFGTGDGLVIDGNTFGPIQIKDITGSGFTLEGDDIDLSNEEMVAEITSMLNEKLVSQGLEVESIMEVDGKIKVKVKPKFESDSDFTEGWNDSELQGILSQQFPDEINGDPITVTYNAQADLKYNITLPSGTEDPQKYIENLMGVKVENLTSTGENSLDYQFNISWGTTGTDGTDLSKPFTDANQAAANLNTQIGTLSSTLSSFTGGQAFATLATDLSSAATDATTLITQLSSTVNSSSIITQIGTIKSEVDTTVKVAQQLSDALSMDKPLEVKFDVTESNTAVTTLLTNLGSLNTLFQPTVTIDDAEAQETIADIMLQLENVGVQNPTPQIDVVDNASATLEKIVNLITSISSKTVTITTKFVTIGSPPGSTDIGGGGGEAQLYTGTINNITGTAYADGSVGRLYSGAKLANKTLVGELGPELAVYDGQYHLLGQTGAEFVELPDDALVFNHLQTAGIISGQMKNARAQAFKGRADAAIAKATGSAMASGNVTGPALASGIAGALAAVRRAKSVWQGLLNSLSVADLLGGGGGGGGGGNDEENNLQAHIEDLQEWYNLSRQIVDLEQQINLLLAERENIYNGHEYLRNLRETQALLEDQVNTQKDLLRYQELQLENQAKFINNNAIWSQFLEVDANGLLQYKNGNNTGGGKGALSVLDQLNQMSAKDQISYIESLGYTFTTNDGEELEDEELVAQFYEDLQKQIDDYDALRDAVQETKVSLEELETEINEIEREIRDNEINLSQEIYDIIVESWEKNIELLQEQNELIQEANEAYAEGLQKAIDAERKLYEQNKNIQDREQLQRQLSLLRRSGGSASEIADLETQLDDMLKEEYFTKQEEAVESIREANERQVELMEQQVKIQEEALEYQKENGVIWTKVYEVMQGTDAEIAAFMTGNSIEFFQKSALVQEDMLLEWAKMIGIYNEEKAYQAQLQMAEESGVWNGSNGSKMQSIYNSLDAEHQAELMREYQDRYATALGEGATQAEATALAQQELYEHLNNYSEYLEAEQKKQKTAAKASSSSSSSGGSSSDGGGSSSKSSSGSSSSSTQYSTPHQGWKELEAVDSVFADYAKEQAKVGAEKMAAQKQQEAPKVTDSLASKTGVTNATKTGFQNAVSNIASTTTTKTTTTTTTTTTIVKPSQVKKNTIQMAYASGGLIDYTGPAWVDGTKSRPERILSAKQTAILEEGLKLNAGYGDRLKERFSEFASKLGSSVRDSISNITNHSDSSSFTIEPGAIQLTVQQLNDKYDVDELYNDITDKLYSIASRASGRGVTRR